MLVVQNDGKDIVATNYFDSPDAARGLLRMSLNAGAFRLLMPAAAEEELTEMHTAQQIVVSRGPWSQAPAREAISVLFDDGGDEPYSLALDVAQLDRLPPPDAAGRRFEFSVWVNRGGKPACALRQPCLFRMSDRCAGSAAVGRNVGTLQRLTVYGCYRLRAQASERFLARHSRCASVLGLLVSICGRPGLCRWRRQVSTSNSIGSTSAQRVPSSLTKRRRVCAFGGASHVSRKRFGNAASPRLFGGSMSGRYLIVGHRFANSGNSRSSRVITGVCVSHWKAFSRFRRSLGRGAEPETTSAIAGVQSRVWIIEFRPPAGKYPADSCPKSRCACRLRTRWMRAGTNKGRRRLGLRFG